MNYWMYDKHGRGDSGGMSQAYRWPEGGGGLEVEDDARPSVGVRMKVGSLYARTMQDQDWWMCSLVTEIISESENEVVFKTRNSIYTWKCN